MKYKDSNNEWQELVVKASDTLPIGFIGISPSETIPYGWLLCDGSEISRTSYADLFKVIGTTYGAGDGSTTFNLPNLKGRIPVGLDASQTEFDTLGEIGGSKYLQEHDHEVAPYVSGISDTGDNYYKLVRGNSAGFGMGRTTLNGNGDSENLQPYIVQNYIIKAKQSTAVVAQAVNEYTTGNDKVYDVDYINKVTDYSTEEQVVGTYLGKPLYKKVVTGNTGTGDSVIILDTSFNISKLINSKGYVQMSSGNQMLINSTMASEPNNNLRAFKHYDGYVMLQFGGNFKSGSYEITLEYTKNTD